MKRLLVLTALLAGRFGAAAAEIPLAATWSFRTDPLNAGVREAWFDPGHDFARWDAMEVPGCWDTRLEYADYTGVAWYATTFVVPEKPAGCDVRLDFESVYADAAVWLNGELLGTHDFAFAAFGYDIGERIVPGAENRLVVRVDNSFKVGATWNWGGIRRPVSLRVLPGGRIERMFVTAEPDLARGSAEVVVKLQFAGRCEGTATVALADAGGRVVARAEVRVAGRREVCVPLRIDEARLWDFDHPYLYTATAVCDGGEPLAERFGVRRIEVDGYRLLLNGRSVRLNGANWVPSDPFCGSALPPEVYRRDIDAMKSCGVNMARLSHWALPREVLDYLDERGMLVIEEIPLWNRNACVAAGHPVPMRWLAELIAERYNHPSVIGWSAGNEIGRTSDNPDIEGYLASAFRQIRSLDSTRLAVYVTHTAAKQYDEPVLRSDLILFNQYGAHGERADEVHRRYPGKPIFYSEYGTRAVGEGLDACADYAAMVGSMQGREYLIGASVWTYNDYRTNYRDGSTAATGNRPWGAVDVFGAKKRGFRALRIVNSPLAGFEALPEGRHLRIVATPRGPLDLPAFRMEGYSVRAVALGAAGDTLRCAVRPLPVVRPGDAPFELRMALPTADAARIVAQLVAPTGYVVHDAVRSLAPPAAPVVARVESGQDRIRVWLDRGPTADEWYVCYGTEESDARSAPTVERFVELERLAYGAEYRIRAVAVNDAGETPAAEVVRVRTRAAELPPVIRHLEQVGRNIRVGYACDFGDFCYEFEYGLDSARLDRRILTTATGACNLPVVVPDAPHYLRIRKRLRYGYASDWSPVYPVKIRR